MTLVRTCTPEGYYGPGFAVHHILGQPEVGHGMARHPAHDRGALVNGDGVPEQGGEAGGGEPAGPEPTTATRLPEAGRGMKRVSCPVSAANRSSAWMATGSSYSAGCIWFRTDAGTRAR